MSLTERIVAAVGLAGLLCLITIAAFADHAGWIHEKHPECCIPHEDCNPVALEYVTIDGDYYVIKHPIYGSFNIAVTNSKISMDKDYWICTGQYGRYPEYFVRCFFRPMVGS